MVRETKPRFNYQKRSKEDVRERANMRGGDFDSIIKPKYKVFKPKDGKNLVRILPPTWPEAKHYGYDLWINYGVGVDNQSYLSLSKMKGEKDPLAEARQAAEKDGDKDLAKALRARQRIGMWLIDRTAEEEGPQFWMTPFSVDKSLLTLSYDEDTKEVLFIDDPEQGCDVRFYKEGQGLKTDYPAEKMKILKPTPLHDDSTIAMDWLEFVQDNPIPDCLQFYDYDHIASIYDGHARIERDEEVEPTRPARAPVKPASDDDDEPPARVRPKVEPQEDPGDEPPQRPRPRVQSEEEPQPEPPKGRLSLRERLRAAREPDPEEE